MTSGIPEDEANFTLILVRHGERSTEKTLDFRKNGLTPHGEEQAEEDVRQIERLGINELHLILASEIERAYRSALHLGKHYGLKVETLLGAHEWQYAPPGSFGDAHTTRQFWERCDPEEPHSQENFEAFLRRSQFVHTEICTRVHHLVKGMNIKDPVVALYDHEQLLLVAFSEYMREASLGGTHKQLTAMPSLQHNPDIEKAIQAFSRELKVYDSLKEQMKRFREITCHLPVSEATDDQIKELLSCFKVGIKTYDRADKRQTKIGEKLFAIYQGIMRDSPEITEEQLIAAFREQAIEEQAIDKHGSLPMPTPKTQSMLNGEIWLCDCVAHFVGSGYLEIKSIKSYRLPEHTIPEKEVLADARRLLRNAGITVEKQLDEGITPGYVGKNFGGKAGMVRKFD